MTGAGEALPPAIMVHSLEHALAAARAAEALGCPLTLVSAPAAAATVGIGWFAALGEAVAARHPALAVSWVLDCGDEAGSVLGALRRGVKHLRFAGPAAVRGKLAAIAARHGAAFDDDPRPPLDLLPERDAEAACRDWLECRAFRPS